MSMWKVTYFNNGLFVIEVQANDLMDLYNQCSSKGVSSWAVISAERIPELKWG